MFSSISACDYSIMIKADYQKKKRERQSYSGVGSLETVLVPQCLCAMWSALTKPRGSGRWREIAMEANMKDFCML